MSVEKCAKKTNFAVESGKWVKTARSSDKEHTVVCYETGEKKIKYGSERRTTGKSAYATSSTCT